MRINMALLAFVTAGALLGSSTALPQTGTLPTTFHDEVEVSINQGASADGFLRVAIQPQGGTKREATIAVTSRMGENEIAQQMADALGRAISPDYEVDRDGGEHVKIRKTRRDAADFSVEITFSAPGFSIVIDT
jgi:hypothetical protein